MVGAQGLYSSILGYLEGEAWYIVWGAVFIHLVQSIRTIALTDGLQPNFSNNGSFLVMWQMCIHMLRMTLWRILY